VILNSSRNEKENKTKISRNLSSQMQRQLKICVNRLIVQNKSARKRIYKIDFKLSAAKQSESRYTR